MQTTRIDANAEPEQALEADQNQERIPAFTYQDEATRFRWESGETKPVYPRYAVLHTGPNRRSRRAMRRDLRGKR